MAHDDPLAWASIPDLARWAVSRFGRAEAVVDGSRRVSWAELGDLVEAAARGYVGAGIEAGDRVGLWAPNGLDWIVAVLGLEAAGAVLVPLSTRYKGAEAAFILGRSRARAVVVARSFLGTDYPALLDGHDLPDLVVRVALAPAPAPAPPSAPPSDPALAPPSDPASSSSSPSDLLAPGWVSWDDFVARGAAVPAGTVAARTTAVRPGDVSDIIFTSGTTGAPKGVMVSHDQSLRVFREWRDIVGLEAGDRYLIVNPMSHTFGYKAGVLAALMTGATMIPLPAFDVAALLEVVDAERVTVLPGPPTLYQSLLNHPQLDRARISSLRLAVTGAAAIPTELVRRMLDELGFDTVITAYGLTESCGCVSACRRGDPVETIARTSGRAFSGVEVRVVDDTGSEVTDGSPGEIVCRGYNVMLGYYEDPGGTAAAIDGDGWLHTGDIGTMDADGNVRVTDRKKDMFIVGGFNAYPAEIENLLLRHPGVAQAAVVGVPDERMGEVGVAFVVPAHGVTLTEDQVMSWARAEMANYKVPRRVWVVDALPLNASGKVLKFELRDRATAAV